MSTLVENPAHQWTLRLAGSEKPLREWGVTGLSRERDRTGADRIRFRVTRQAPLKAALASHPAARALLLRDESCIHAGILRAIPAAQGNSHGAIESEGPMEQLGRIMYQQSWDEADFSQPEPPIASKLSPEVILGRDAGGNPLAVGPQIAEIVSFAAQHGSIQTSALGLPAGPVPIAEAASGIDCATAIRRVLRWIPGASIHFEFDGPDAELPGKGNLCLTLSQDQTVHTIKLGISDGPGTTFASVEALTGRIPSAVSLFYNQEVNTGSEAWRQTSLDRHPASAPSDPGAPDHLALTTQLAAGQLGTIQQELTTEPLDLGNGAWWGGRIPALRGIDPTSITVLSHQREDNLGLANELLSGQVAGWMNVNAERSWLNASISYTDIFGHSIQADAWIELVTTDAASGVYQKIADETTAETPPAHLAESLYQDLQRLGWRGTIELRGTRALADDWRPGRRLSLSGGEAEWTSINAPVRDVRLDYGAETVTITFGPDSRDLTKVAADLAVNRDSRALSLLASPRQGGSRPAPQHQLPTLVPLRNAGLR